jgi:hypothetical protein
LACTLATRFADFDVPLKPGNCVYLKSPARLPYVALVESVGPVHIKCRWFYRLAELPAPLRKSLKNTECCELFLSSHCDSNELSSVIRTCDVTHKLEHEPNGDSTLSTMVIDGHLVCRFAFDVTRQLLGAVWDWNANVLADSSTLTTTNGSSNATSLPREHKSGEFHDLFRSALNVSHYGPQFWAPNFRRLSCPAWAHKWTRRFLTF